MRTKIRAYRKTNFVLIRKFTDYLHRFFIVSKGGAMEAIPSLQVLEKEVVKETTYILK